MKKFLVLPLLVIFITSCKSTNPNSHYENYLNLSHDKDLVSDFWVVKKRVDPNYPSSAARKYLSGCSEIIVGIDTNGKPNGYSIKKSYPKGLFDKQATAALSKWRWKPTKNNSVRKPVLAVIQLDFLIDGARNKSEVEANCSLNEV